jgi:hypothetical protein
VRALRAAAKVLLVFVTLVFLASMGGGMVFVWWVLVPLHWLASLRSGPWGTAGWALLAGASVSEVAWMTLYVLSGHNETVAVATMGVSFIATSALFVWAHRSRTIRSLASSGSYST